MSAGTGPSAIASSISKTAALSVRPSSSRLQSTIITSTPKTRLLYTQIMSFIMAPFAIILRPCRELKGKGCCCRLSFCIEGSLKMDIRMVMVVTGLRIWSMLGCSKMESLLGSVFRNRRISCSLGRFRRTEVRGELSSISITKKLL